MFFTKLFRRTDPMDDIAAQLYGAVVEKARDPVFYARLAVPDTVNGRFDMVVIHAMLVLRRMRGGGEQADITGKALLELLFRDMDQSLREMGVGDMGIGKHIKRMAKALFGRAEAYEKGLDDVPGSLVGMLRENIYRHTPSGGDHIFLMEDYMRRAAAHLATQDVAAIMAGKVNFDVAVVA